MSNQTVRRKEIYEALHPEAKAQVRQGLIRQGAAADNLSAAFTTETARATGRDARTVRRDAARGEALGEDLNRIAGTSLDKGVELDASPDEADRAEATALWAKLTMKGAGAPEGNRNAAAATTETIVDNVNDCSATRPTGNSKDAGMRRLIKAAEDKVDPDTGEVTPGDARANTCRFPIGPRL